MGRQKISKVDHLKRTEVIKRELSQSKNGSTPSKTVPLETQTLSSKKTTPSAKQLNRKHVSTPSKTVPLETQTPSSKKTTPSAKQLNRKHVSTPSKTVPLQTQTLNPPPKQSPPKKRITTVYTPPARVWNRDYRNDNVREQNVVEKDNSTKISVTTSYQGSNHSEVSLTMTYTNVVHSTLHRNQSPDLFSDIDELNENTEGCRGTEERVEAGMVPSSEDQERMEETVATDFRTERAEAGMVPSSEDQERIEETVATDFSTVRVEAGMVPSSGDQDRMEDTIARSFSTERVEAGMVPSSDWCPAVVRDTVDSVCADRQTEAGRVPNSRDKGIVSKRRTQTIDLRKERKRKIESEPLKNSDNPKTIKKLFKNRVKTIATGGHELHRKARRTPDYMILIRDSVHSKDEKNPRVTAGKILAFGEGELARQFVHNGLKFNRDNYFFHKNPYNLEEKCEFSDNSDIDQSSDVSITTNVRDGGSDIESNRDISLASDQSSDNGCYQHSKTTKKDNKKQEAKAIKAKEKKKRQEANKILSSTDMTDILPASRQKIFSKKPKKIAKQAKQKKK